MKDTVWIVGHGLLGSRIEAMLLTDSAVEVFRVGAFPWNDPSLFQTASEATIRSFGERVIKNGGAYRIFWTAGKGIMSSTNEDMSRETSNLRTFMQMLAADTNLQKAKGTLSFSSSAGGVYGGSKEDVITEASAACPTTAYGRGKLEHLKLLHDSLP
jgi:UDP-glucose 4-epimerase